MIDMNETKDVFEKQNGDFFMLNRILDERF
jgi:hypothetical protein